MGAILARNGIKFLLTAIGIFMIGSLPYLLFDMKGQVAVLRLIQKGALSNADFLADSIQFDVGGYFSHMWQTVMNLSQVGDWQYLNDSGKPLPLFPQFLDAYVHSMFLLVCALILGLLFGVFFTYLILMIPLGKRTPVRFLLFVLESLPDLFVIIVFQWLVLWFNKKTGILLMNTDTIFGEAYALPIICLSFLPMFYIVKYLVTAFEEEESQLYVELAKGKGLKRTVILLVHILRNALITLFHHFKTIFWFGLSNLLALEVVFHMEDGFITFLWDHGPLNPDILTIGLLMVFVPFFILLTAGEAVIKESASPEKEVL